MPARTIVAIVTLSFMSLCGMFSTFAYFEIIDKVNEKLSKEEQFGWLGWSIGKYRRLHREYRRLYPDGRLLFKVNVLTVLAFASLIVSAWSFGFF
jgi:hypothetical protein